MSGFSNIEIIFPVLIFIAIGLVAFAYKNKRPDQSRSTLGRDIILIFLSMVVLMGPASIDPFKNPVGTICPPASLSGFFKLMGEYPRRYPFGSGILSTISFLVALNIVWPLWLAASIITGLNQILPIQDKNTAIVYTYARRFGEIFFLASAVYLWAAAQPYSTAKTMFLSLLLPAFYGGYHAFLGLYKIEKPDSKDSRGHSRIIPIIWAVVGSLGMVGFIGILVLSNTSRGIEIAVSTTITAFQFILGFFVFQALFCVPYKYVVKASLAIVIICSGCYLLETNTKVLSSQFSCASLYGFGGQRF